MTVGSLYLSLLPSSISLPLLPCPHPDLPLQALILGGAGNASGTAVCVAFAVLALIAAIAFHLYMTGTTRHALYDIEIPVYCMSS